MTRPTHALRPILAALTLAAAATAATAQDERNEPRTFVPPPPSATSTGGAPIDPASVKELRAPPSLRGAKLETRDVLHPDAIELVGLEQSGKPYRPDLDMKRSPLAAHPSKSEGNLHDRQLAIFSGGTVSARLPEVAPKLNMRATFAAGASEFANEARPWWALTAIGTMAFAVLLVRRKLAHRH